MSKKKSGPGRPKKDASVKKMMVTVRVRPANDKKWAQFAKRCKTGKGNIVEHFVAAPEAEGLRRQFVSLVPKFKVWEAGEDGGRDWTTVDWRHGNETIARKMGVTPRAVRFMRAKFEAPVPG